MISIISIVTSATSNPQAYQPIKTSTEYWRLFPYPYEHHTYYSTAP